MTPSPPFEEVTETTGTPISQEGMRMMYTRYRAATRLAFGGRVLDIGCGTGQGLGLLGAAAAQTVGSDYSRQLLRSARAHYGTRFPLVCLTAEHLPFADGRFDVVLCFEASYYIPDATAAFREMTRVLGPGGELLFVNANPERPDFIKSPYSTHYHTADEFRQVLNALGLQVTVEVAFPLGTPDSLPQSIAGLAARTVRRLLARLHLVPRTLTGRARLKRLLSGRLTPVPAELTNGAAKEAPRNSVEPGPVRGHKVLYVTARKIAGTR